MNSFASTIAGNSRDLTEEEQKKMGTPVSGSMGDEHRNFLKKVFELVDGNAVDLYNPQSLLNEDIYNSLDETWRDKSDLTLINVANQLRRIQEFRLSADTPDESPQLQAMIEELWQMKQRIEEHYDVFKI